MHFETCCRTIIRPYRLEQLFHEITGNPDKKISDAYPDHGFFNRFPWFFDRSSIGNLFRMQLFDSFYDALNNYYCIPFVLRGNTSTRYFSYLCLEAFCYLHCFCMLLFNNGNPGRITIGFCELFYPQCFQLSNDFFIYFNAHDCSLFVFSCRGWLLNYLLHIDTSCSLLFTSQEFGVLLPGKNTALRSSLDTSP